MKYETLDWDTNFFGVKIARIIPTTLDEKELSEILSLLRKNEVQLVYWTSKLKMKEHLINKLGGFLVDTKTTFTIAFRSLDFDKNISTSAIEPFIDSMSINDLECLAIQSGKYSRFFIDPNISHDKFEDLYKIWINRSLQKEIASEVLLIRHFEKIIGMVTLVEEKGRGDIGIIAVDINYRANHYGEKLVRAAQRWFLENGFEYGQVVTQQQNTPACNLYKKCGYKIEKVDFFYHFWL